MNLDTRLGALKALGLIRNVGGPGDGEYLFRHTLFQETAYRSLLRGERVDLHRSVAGVLEKTLAGDEEAVAPILAYHFQQAGDELRALHYFTLAAKTAAKVYANQEAIEHYQQAIDLALRVAPEPERLIELYVGCGRLHELMGDFPGALSTYDEMQAKAMELANPRLEIRARVARDTLYSSPSALNDPRKAMESARATLEMAQSAGDLEAEARSLWNLLLAGFFIGTEDTSRAYGDRALALARRVGDKQLQAFILNDLSRSNLFFEGRQQLGLELLNEAIGLWKELDNLPMLADSLNGQAMFAAYSGEYDKALKLSEEGLALSTEIDNPWGKAYSLYIRCEAYWDLGDYMQALRHGEEANHWAQIAGFVVPQVHASAIQAWSLGDLGLQDQAEQVIQEAVECARTSLVSWLPLPLAVQVMLALSRSDPAAPQLFADLHKLVSQPDAHIFPVAAVYAYLAEATYYLNAGEFQASLDVSEELLKMESSFNFKTFATDIQMARAKAARALGEVDLAQSALAEAISVAETTGAARNLWRILFLLSQWAEEDGRPEAGELMAQSRAALAPIVGKLSEERRKSFLATPDAAAVWSHD